MIGTPRAKFAPGRCIRCVIGALQGKRRVTVSLGCQVMPGKARAKCAALVIGAAGNFWYQAGFGQLVPQRCEHRIAVTGDCRGVVAGVRHCGWDPVGGRRTGCGASSIGTIADRPANRYASTIAVTAFLRDHPTRSMAVFSLPAQAGPAFGDTSVERALVPRARTESASSSSRGQGASSPAPERPDRRRRARHAYRGAGGAQVTSRTGGHAPKAVGAHVCGSRR